MSWLQSLLKAAEGFKKFLLNFSVVYCVFIMVNLSTGKSDFPDSKGKGSVNQDDFQYLAFTRKVFKAG